MSKKQKQTSTSTQTPIIPDDVRAGLNKFMARSTGLLDQPPESFRAGWNPFQDTAASRAGNLGVNPALDRAYGILDLVGNYQVPTIKAENVAADITKYQNPFTQQVVDTSLGGFDRKMAKDLAQLDLTQAGGGAGAFGGSGAALERGTALSEGNLNRGQLEAGLRNQGFTQAASTALETATRNQQAQLAKQQQGLQIAQMFGDLGAQKGASDRADVATLLGAGGDLYNVQDRIASAPLDVLQQLQQVYGGAANPFIGSQTTSTGTVKGGGLSKILGALGTLAQGAGALGFSPFASGASPGFSDI